MLKIILLATGELGSSLLLGILESSHQIVGVINWEKVIKEKNKSKKLFKNNIKQDIKQILYPDNFNSLIKFYKIPEIKAKSANNEEFRKKAGELKPDIILIGGWGEILKKETINIPKISSINCHPSLLPKHRGAAPFASVLLEGESKTGVTFHNIDENIDTGEILLQKEFDILDSDTGSSIRSKCTYKAREQIAKLLDDIENGLAVPQIQNNSSASYFEPLSAEDIEIDWNESAQLIHNKIRGVFPWKKCFTRYKGQILNIGSSKIMELEIPILEAGKIISKTSKNLMVSTGDTHKAILLEDLTIKGFMSKFRTRYFILSTINIRDYLLSIGLLFGFSKLNLFFLCPFVMI